MDEATRRLMALSTEQQGLVTRAQLFTIGLTKRQIDHAIDTERLTLVHRTVYRVAGSAITADNVLAAGLLLTDGAASHRSAAHLLGLVDSSPSRPEITVAPTQSQRTVGLILHRSRDLAPADVIRVRSLRCTTATRTLVDLGAVTSGAVLESALERALHQRMTTVPRLRKRLEEVGRPGRPGVTSLRRVLDLRTPTLAAAESELELLLWQILRRHGLPLPERQVKVTVAGRNYRLDLAYRAERIFIEGDGFGVHSPRAVFESDRTRQNKLVGAGWAPLLFTWQRARQSEADVAEEVRDGLASRRQGFGSA